MLARFERLVEGAVEGGLRRIFPRSLQPVQLAKASARAMDRARVVGVRGPEVPNLYVVRLAPADLLRFDEYRAGLQGDVTRYLSGYAAERGLRPVAALRAELVSDVSVPAGTVRVEARFVDVPSTEPPAGAVWSAAPPGPVALAPGWLVAVDGRRESLDPARGRVRLGRAPDNDVVLQSDHVSRYHTELRWQDGAWHVHDLGSTNGTFVDDRPVEQTPLPLPRGATLRIGDQQLRHGDPDATE